MNGNASLLIAIIAYVAVAVTTLAYAVFVRKAKLADPILQFVFFLSLFVLPLPVRACMTLDIEGDITDHLLELMPYSPRQSSCSCIAFGAFALTYYSRAGISSVTIAASPRRSRWRLASVILRLFHFPHPPTCDLRRRTAGFPAPWIQSDSGNCRKRLSRHGIHVVVRCVNVSSVRLCH